MTLTSILLESVEGKLLILAACGQAFAARGQVVADAADAVTDEDLDDALMVFAKVGMRLEVMARTQRNAEDAADCISLSAALRHLLTGDDETPPEINGHG